MIKQLIRLSVILFLLSVLQITARAQSYNIKSFEGITSTIKLTYKVLTSRALAVSYLKDTLFLDEYMYINKVRVLHDKFLEITYNTRGGSGLSLRNTLVLSINKGKINVSMFVTSYVELVSPDKGRLYTLKFNMTGSDKSNYKVIVGVHDVHRSKINPQTDSERNQQVTLRFDSSQNIFYSTHKDVSKSFIVYDSKTQQSTKQYVNGMLPVITLGENEYYYIKNEWYERSDNDNLIKSAHR